MRPYRRSYKVKQKLHNSLHLLSEKSNRLNYRSADNGTISVAGYDYGAEEDRSFTDKEFMAIPSSIDGMATEMASSSASVSVSLCHCGLPVAIKRVFNAGPNQGRTYKTCSKPSTKWVRRCIFGWATAKDADAMRRSSLSALVDWQRFSSTSGFRMTSSKGWAPDSILQGRVATAGFSVP